MLLVLLYIRGKLINLVDVKNKNIIYIIQVPENF